MSGKKSCEVASVLSQTENIQREIFTSYANEIKSSFKSIEKLNERIETNKNRIMAYEAPDMSDIERELPIEAVDIKNRIKSMKNSMLKKNTENINKFKEKRNAIQNSIEEENSKGKRLREVIRNSDHYMDKEYRQAEEIKENISNLKNSYRELKHNTSSMKNSAMKTDTEVSAKVEVLDEVTNQVTRLDIQAKKIKAIRNEANALKDDISNSFAEVDAEKSIKFVPIDYNELLKRTNVFKSLSNEKVISSHGLLSSDITKLKSDYHEAYSKWIEKRNYSKSILDEIIGKGLKEELVLIENIVNDIDEKISKFAYYDNYMGSKTFDKFEELMRKANALYEKEQFEECNTVALEAKELYEKTSNEADSLREKIEASTNLSFKIRDIMLSDAVNFREAHLEIIDGNPMNGFRLECQNGDTINFEEIKFDDNGELVVSLDHIENTNGTCGVRWGQMQKAFNEQGIPLTDVVKDGSSVIYRDVRKKETNNKVKQRG